VTRLVPALVFSVLASACGGSDAPPLTGRSPPLASPSATSLGAVSGSVTIIIDSEFTAEGDHGIFSIQGALNDEGELISRAIEDGTRVTIERELRGELGTIFIHMEGAARKEGEATRLAWRITGGTDSYEGLTGSGTGADEFAGPTSLQGRFTGSVEN
jgi:hypothetical protein